MLKDEVVQSSVEIVFTQEKRAEEELRKSGDKFQTLINLMPDPAVIVDGKGKFLAVNDKVEEKTGFKREELLGKNFLRTKIVTAKSKAILMKNLAKRMMGMHVAQYEVEALTKDGKKIAVEINAAKIEYEGKPADLVIFRDITERKKAEEELVRLSSAVKMSTDSIVISNLDGKIIDVNKASLKMYGIDDERDLIGKSSFDLIISEDREKALAGMKEVLEKGYVKSREYHIMTQDGSRILVEMSVAIMKDADGKPIGFVGISRDITERRKMEEALKCQRDIAITLSGAGTLSEVLNRLFDNLLKIEEFDCAGFYLVDEDTGDLDMIVHRGLPEGFVEKVGHLDADSPYAKVVMEGKPIYQKTSDFPPVIREDLQSDGILAVAAIPIQYKGEAIGDLNMASHTHGEISASTRHVLESVGAQIGEAIVRARMEEKLRESEEKFRNLAEQSPNMIFINKKGRIVYANSKCEEITGYKREEFYSPDFDFLTLIDPQFKDSIRASFIRHMKGEGVAPYEFTLVTKEEKRIDVMSTTNLIRYDGESAILGILTDITDRKRMENELRSYSENLEELVEERTRELKESQEQLIKSERLAAVGELATMVGHDLRNPLQAIENATYYLNNELSYYLIPQKAMKMLQVISDSVNYADRIIRDLQDFSATKKPSLEKTDINTIVKETLSQVEAPENVELITELSHLPKIKVDKDMIKRGFLNLATNGIQAMKNRGTLKVSTKKTQGFIEVSFKDTGIGMSKENIEKIFTPFFTTKAKGMGMGLAICKRFVESHDGSIQVESEEGKGSTFTVKLPIQPRQMEVKTTVEE